MASTKLPKYRSARTTDVEEGQGPANKASGVTRSETAALLPPTPRVASKYGEQESTHEVVQSRSAKEPLLHSEPSMGPIEATKPQMDELPDSSDTQGQFIDFGELSHLSRPTWSFFPAVDSSYRPTTPSATRLQNLDPSSAKVTTHRSTSPASSFSSFHKAASSTNLAADSSPASSRSAQGSTVNNAPTGSNTSGPRLSKAKMTLLNPVSLLKRRRTSQLLSEIVPEPVHRPLKSPALKLPDGYDPRIKGKGVHDFNAPKPKRNYTTNDLHRMAENSTTAPDNLTESVRRSSTPAVAVESRLAEIEQSPEKEHVPVFVENFEDEPAQDSEASAVHRESLANSSFLARMSKQLNFDTLVFPEPKAQEQKPSAEPPPQSPHHHHARSSKTDTSSYRHSSDRSTIHSSVSTDTKATSPSHSPLRAQSGASLTLDAPFQPYMPLKHVPSSASHSSRFSFQFNSERSIAQEKALEEKHNQKVAAKASKHVSLADSRFEELEENEVDDYDEMDDGGFEEDIPMVNTDAGPDEMFGSLNTRSRLSMPLHAVEKPASTPSESTIEVKSETIESAQHPPQDQDTPESAEESDARPCTPKRVPTGLSTRTDDMYYDDGLIEHASTTEPGDFDEAAAFDSPIESHTDQRASEDAVTPRRQPPGLLANLPKIATQPQDLDNHYRSRSASKTPNEMLPVQHGPNFVHRQKASFEQLTNPAQSLNAYHRALARAASRAAQDGKFERKISVQTSSSKYSDDADEKRPSALDSGDSGDNDDGWVDLPDPVRDYNTLPDEVEDDEDLMVAEANAEVLASDEAEFYGREFGFYGVPGTGGTQTYNGGVFERPDGDKPGIGHSLLREPNLTPITERSEYSTRNSFVGGFGSSLPGGFPSSTSRERENPFSNLNLKDLAANVGLDDEEMTLSQLMRLRKETFGGVPGNSSNRSSLTAGGASGSSDDNSSPSSLGNSSPLGLRFHNLPGTQHPLAIHHDRRPSATEQPIAEVPEAEIDDDSDTLEFSSSPPVPRDTRRKSSGAAEAFAQEYSNIVSSPVMAAQKLASSPSPRRGSPSPSLPTSAVYTQRLASVSPLTSPESQQSPVSSPGAGPHSTASMSPPMPSAAMMQKFASRPAPDAYRKSWQPSSHQHRNSLGGGGGGLVSPQTTAGTGADSVAYVQEADEEGNVRWFLERRRKKSDGPEGELVVVGRERVEGGI